MKILIIGASSHDSVGFKLMEHINAISSEHDITLVGRSDRLTTICAVPHNVDYVQLDAYHFGVSGLRARVAYGDFDIVIQAVSSHGYQRAKDITYTGLQEHVQDNLHINLQVAQACRTANKNVRCVFLSSDAAVKPMTNNLLYNMNKAALEMMARELAHEWRDEQVRIMCIRPPHVRDTQMAKTLYHKLVPALGVTYEEARSRVIADMPKEVEDELIRYMATIISSNMINDPRLFHTQQVIFDCSARVG